MKLKPLKFKRELADYKNTGLGVFAHDRKIYMLLSVENKLQIDRSTNGYDFDLYDDDVNFANNTKDLSKYSDFRLSHVGEKYFLTYKKIIGDNSSLLGAVSGDLANWEDVGKIATPAETGMLVPSFKHKDQFILYLGENSLSVATSSDLKSWKLLGSPVKELTQGLSGSKIKISDISLTKSGILLFYFLKTGSNGTSKYFLKVALFDLENPEKILWDRVIWKQIKNLHKQPATPIGSVLASDLLISYWQGNDGKIFALTFEDISKILLESKPLYTSSVINKFSSNPILEPIIHHFWESKAVFNPTAFYDEGEVHIIYRAVGDSYMSSMGYAKSGNGIDIDSRSNHPVYVPTQHFEGGQHFSFKKRLSSADIKKYLRSAFVSGPGWGGTEDPRVTKIGDKLYMTYVAFDGSSPPRVAITSIDTSDFHNEEWNWTKPVLLSPPGEIHKNWVIFPEMINGKYAILHSISPSISIDYVDSLDFDGKSYIKSLHKPTQREEGWESWIRGPGPPPIKTKYGWLLFYHAMDKFDPGKYKVGAMILDYNSPEKILYQANNPIIGPDKSYENDGLKTGVVYASGAVIIGDQLIVYYGGSDTCVCAAKANINTFLSQVTSSSNSSNPLLY